MKFVFVSLIILGFVSQANAQSTTTINSTTIQTPAEPKPKIFSATLLLDTSTTLAPGSAGSGSGGEGYAQSGTYQLILGAKLPWDLSLSAKGSYSQEYTYVRADGRSGDFDDTIFSLSKKVLKPAKDFTISTGVSLILPTNNETQKSTLKSVLGFSVPIAYKWKKLEISTAPKFSQSFHEAEVQANGRLNTAYSFSILNTIAYSFTDKLSASIVYAPSRGFTYQGTTRDKYSLIYEVGYAWTDKFSTAVGLANVNASSLHRTGVDSNYTLYDATQTVGYFDLILTL
ncbi:MAG: hypothetical protein SGI74_13260 [Oligoflexia bacterium]|nr:hypothetical protein [Oligoflexia bacterium]